MKQLMAHVELEEMARLVGLADSARKLLRAAEKVDRQVAGQGYAGNDAIVGLRAAIRAAGGKVQPLTRPALTKAKGKAL